MAVRWQDYIDERKDDVLAKPIFKGTHLFVEHILNDLNMGIGQKDVLTKYPSLTPEHIQAARLYAPGWDKKVDLEIPPEIEDQYEGKWIAWDTLTSQVVVSGKSMDEVLDGAADHSKRTGHLIWYHNVLPRDTVMIGGLG